MTEFLSGTWVLSSRLGGWGLDTDGRFVNESAPMSLFSTNTDRKPFRFAPPKIIGSERKGCLAKGNIFLDQRCEPWWHHDDIGVSYSTGWREDGEKKCATLVNNGSAQNWWKRWLACLIAPRLQESWTQPVRETELIWWKRAMSYILAVVLGMAGYGNFHIKLLQEIVHCEWVM